jgi:hypothetical protein
MASTYLYSAIKCGAILTPWSRTSPPTLADVLNEILSGGENKSHYAQIRDLKLAAKTLSFIQQHRGRFVKNVF